jgi:hypothetical protein
MMKGHDMSKEKKRYAIDIRYTEGLADSHGRPIGNRDSVLQIWESDRGEHESLEEARREAERRGYTYTLLDEDELRMHQAAIRYDRTGKLAEQRVTKDAGEYAPVWAEDFLYASSHTDISLARLLKIGADSSDEELEKIADMLSFEAKNEGIHLCGDVLEILHRVRDAVREHEREESAEESE